MKLIDFNNDDSFFTSEDKDNFNEIVGNSIEDLKREILKQSQETINLIYKSDNKFVYLILCKISYDKDYYKQVRLNQSIINISDDIEKNFIKKKSIEFNLQNYYE